MSGRGQLTLYIAVLAKLPTYYMSIFHLPSSIIAELERTMSNFLWEEQNGSKMNHLVKWDIASKALLDGGLAVGNLKNRNLALLFKWNWWFLKDPDAFWCKIVPSIHGVDIYHWHTSRKYGLSLRNP